jgi:hypothetical protein
VVDSSPHPRKERKRAGSPLKQSITVDDEEDGSLSPPPEAQIAPEPKVKEEAALSQGDEMEVDDEGGEGSSRRTKRKKVSYVESGSDSDSEDDIPIARGKGRAAARKPRKSLKAESDSDDFVFDDDDELAMSKYEI